MFSLTSLRLRRFRLQPLSRETRKQLAAGAAAAKASSSIAPFAYTAGGPSASSSAPPLARLNPQAYNRTPVSEVVSGGDLKAYLAKFWIVVFSLSSGPTHAQQLAEVKRHLQWYGGRHRVVSLDRHIHAMSLLAQIKEWRAREEAAAQMELDERSRRVRGAGTSSHVHGFGGSAGDDPSASSISLESSATRSMYTRSNLTDFGQLFLSPSPLPAVFVNGHYLGGLEDLQMLEKQRKLKDIIQFGFEWKSSKFMKPMEDAHKDAALFKAQYVGAPVLKPVAMLPQVSTRFNVDDPFEGRIQRQRTPMMN